jgi:hypothetical protein
MNRTLTLVALSALAVGVAHAKKKAEEAPPPVGWHTVEATKKDPGWRGSCYNPPAWDKLPETDRRMARQQALAAMKAQWLGQREEFVSFSAIMVEDLETTLLGRPDKIEMVTAKNAEYCVQVMSQGADTEPWSTWLSGLPARLTAGECNNPLDYQLIQYLDINRDWQEQVPFCKGNRAVIEASPSDNYRIVKGGDWINADGDPSQPASDATLPCNFDGCFLGQLVGKFVTEQGVVTVFPVGTRKEFEAPENGTFSFMINDTTFYDNDWRSQGTITDHTAVTVSPAE